MSICAQAFFDTILGELVTSQIAAFV